MRGGDEVVAERLAHVLVHAGVRGAQHHALRVVQVDQEAVLGQELLLLDCGGGGEMVGFTAGYGTDWRQGSVRKIFPFLLFDIYVEYDVFLSFH